MEQQVSMVDDILNNCARALRTCFAKPDPARPTPEVENNPRLTHQERAQSIQLMRVNHAGEVSAQALYFGQALVAKNQTTRNHLIKAATEEHDHLAWCAQRLEDLDGRTSLLTPFWYTGSFVIGVCAGLLGDSKSLGFVAETENQVEAHLNDHLRKLPTSDIRSRAILETMAEDEARHGADAIDAGAESIPLPGRKLMALGGSVLRQVARIL